MGGRGRDGRWEMGGWEMGDGRWNIWRQVYQAKPNNAAQSIHKALGGCWAESHSNINEKPLSTAYYFIGILESVAIAY